MRSVSLVTMPLLLTAGVWMQAQVTVSYDALPPGGPLLVDSSSVPLVNSSTVRIGTFNVPDVSAIASDLAALDAAWVNLGSASTFTFPSLSGGFFSGNNTQNLPGLDGKQIYLWAFNTGSAVAPGFGSGGYGSVLDYVVMTSTSDPDWVFPSSSGPSGTTSIYTSDTLTLYHGSSGGGVIQLAAVPEPVSASAAVGVCLALFALLRRRRSQPKSC